MDAHCAHKGHHHSQKPARYSIYHIKWLSSWLLRICTQAGQVELGAQFYHGTGFLQCGAGGCRVLQVVALCCSVLKCVAGRCRVLQCVALCCSVLQRIAACCRLSSALSFTKAQDSLSLPPSLSLSLSFSLSLSLSLSRTHTHTHSHTGTFIIQNHVFDRAKLVYAKLSCDHHTKTTCYKRDMVILRCTWDLQTNVEICTNTWEYSAVHVRPMRHEHSEQHMRSGKTKKNMCTSG